MRATPVGTKIAPLVYLSLSGTSEEEQPTKERGNEKSVGINMSALDQTELVPDSLSQVKNPASPVKFTEEVVNYYHVYAVYTMMTRSKKCYDLKCDPENLTNGRIRIGL